MKTGILVDDLVLYAIGRNVPCGEHAKKPISTEIVYAFFRAGRRPRKLLGRRSRIFESVNIMSSIYTKLKKIILIFDPYLQSNL